MQLLPVFAANNVASLPCISNDLMNSLLRDIVGTSLSRLVLNMLLFIIHFYNFSISYFVLH